MRYKEEKGNFATLIAKPNFVYATFQPVPSFAKVETCVLIIFV